MTLKIKQININKTYKNKKRVNITPQLNITENTNKNKNKH